MVVCPTKAAANPDNLDGAEQLDKAAKTLELLVEVGINKVASWSLAATSQLEATVDTFVKCMDVPQFDLKAAGFSRLYNKILEYYAICDIDILSKPHYIHDNSYEFGLRHRMLACLRKLDPVQVELLGTRRSSRFQRILKDSSPKARAYHL